MRRRWCQGRITPGTLRWQVRRQQKVCGDIVEVVPVREKFVERNASEETKLPKTPLTLKFSLFSGANITMFLIPFLMEVHLNARNFVVTSYLNKLTPTLPLTIRLHRFPTNNRCYGLAGAALHFATLKATLL